MFLTLFISILVITVFIASVLFFPSVIVRKHMIKVYSIVPVIGALILIMSDRIGFFEIISAFSENTSVNPLKILILFLSMTVFSLVLEQTGFFAYISTKALKKAGDNQFVIFTLFYVVISLLTVFTSNDIIILTFTPFICHFCKASKISSFPYLFMEFVAANTWSLLLIIGNPTNIYVCGTFGIDFITYFKTMLLPTVFAGVTSFFIMIAIFFKRLKKKMESCEEHGKITDKPIMIISLVHLCVCIFALAISQYIGVEMWIVAFFLALSEIIFVLLALLLRRKKLNLISKSISGMPFEIIPFIVGMFIIVLALERSGITHTIERILEPYPDILTYGYLSFLSDNLVNNIPMSVLFSKILAASGNISMQGIYATVAGSNIGAFFTPIGALAGIMWMNLLRKNGKKVSYFRFFKYGIVIGVPTITAAILALFLVL